MRYLILVLALVSFSASAEPVRLTTGDTANISWDASATEGVTYNVYMTPRVLVASEIIDLKYAWLVNSDVGIVTFFVVAEKNAIESDDSNTDSAVVVPGKSGNFAVQ